MFFLESCLHCLNESQRKSAAVGIDTMFHLFWGVGGACLIEVHGCISQ